MSATTPGIQIVVDALDPHAQAQFWSAVLGYDVEDTTQLIRGLRDSGLVHEGDFFAAYGRLWFRDLVGIRDPQQARPRLLFQRAEGAKPSTRNRMHIDVNVGRDRRGDEVERIVALGAAILYDIDEPGGRHTTMADPEGNEFCVQ